MNPVPTFIIVLMALTDIIKSLKMMKKNIYFSLLSFTMLAAQANDTAGTTAAGGLNFIKNPNIALIREELTISPNTVKVSYLFQNKSNQDITTSMFFPLPPYKNQSVYGNWTQPTSTQDQTENAASNPFTNFSVTADDATIQYKTLTRAIFNGQDITDKLIAAQIPTDPASIGPNVRIDDKIKPDWLAKARALKLTDAKGKALWQKQTVYSWTQTFPAQQPILIEHEYTPATGKFFITLPTKSSLNSVVNDTANQIHSVFNLNIDELQNSNIFKNWLVRQIQAIKTPVNDANDTTQNQSQIYFYNVDYILTTANNWAGPIKNFTLKIVLPDNGAVAYNKFYGNQDVDIKNENKQLTFFIQNFKPEQNLNVLFGSSDNLANN